MNGYGADPLLPTIGPTFDLFRQALRAYTSSRGNRRGEVTFKGLFDKAC